LKLANSKCAKITTNVCSTMQDTISMMSQTHDYYLFLQTTDSHFISYNIYVYCRLVQCYAKRPKSD